MNKKQRSIAFVIISFAVLGSLHFLSVYLDSFRYNYQFEVTLKSYTAYVIPYLSWPLLIYALYKLLNATPVKYKLPYQIAVFFTAFFAWVHAYAFIDQASSNLINQTSERWFPNIYSNWTANTWFVVILVYSVAYGICLTVLFQKNANHAREQAYTLSQQAAELNLAKTRFQMQALVQQLSPHFLFNCLSMIALYGRENNGQKVVSTTSQLAELLRYATLASREEHVTLHDEVEFANTYANLQLTRFSGKLTCSIETDEKIPCSRCAPLIIQPLLENAFLHGSDQHINKIKANITLEQQNVVIYVSNIIDKKPSSGLGTGLDNLQQRLAIYYEGRAKLTHLIQEKLYTTKLTIPLKVI